MVATKAGGLAGWISCQRRIFETLVFSLQPPSNKFGANGKSPLKWTGNNSLVTINPPCTKAGGLGVGTPDPGSVSTRNANGTGSKK
jgi:hypothetical protein